MCGRLTRKRIACLLQSIHKNDDIFGLIALKLLFLLLSSPLPQTKRGGNPLISFLSRVVSFFFSKLNLYKRYPNRITVCVCAFVLLHLLWIKLKCDWGTVCIKKRKRKKSCTRDKTHYKWTFILFGSSSDFTLLATLSSSFKSTQGKWFLHFLLHSVRSDPYHSLWLQKKIIYRASKALSFGLIGRVGSRNWCKERR